METIDLVSQLPQIYHGFLPASLRLPVLEESFATCNNCAMVTSAPSGRHCFSPKTKCCTYFPSLPNYLVGSLLKDERSAVGRERILVRIEAKIGVSPAGVFVPRLYNAIYQRGRERGFGRSESMICPYYQRDTGMCSIWRHRESICSTFFCKTICGEPGKKFWKAVKNYLLHAQRVLSIQALLSTKISSAASVIGGPLSRSYFADPLSAEEVDQVIDQKEYSNLWQEYEGREVEFFIKCHDVVSGLSAAEFEAVAGIERECLLSDITTSHELSVQLPPVLKRGGAKVLTSDDGREYIINNQAINVSFSVPTVVLDCFDGRTETGEILRRLADVHGVAVQAGMIIALFHARALIGS